MSSLARDLRILTNSATCNFKTPAAGWLARAISYLTFAVMGTIGRALQIIGLVVLPLGMVLELTGRLGRRGVSEMLLMMVFGCAAFYLGRYLEGVGQRS